MIECTRFEWRFVRGGTRKDHPVAADPEEDLTGAANRMIEHNVRSMPVVQGGRVKGVIRLRDILLYIEHEIE